MIIKNITSIKEIDSIKTSIDYYTSYDGIDEYTKFGNGSELDFSKTDPFTIVAWVTRKTATRATIVSRVNNTVGYWFYIDSSGVLSIELRNSASNNMYVKTTTTIPVGGIYMVSCTYGGSGTITGLKAQINSVYTLGATRNMLTLSSNLAGSQFRVGAYSYYGLFGDLNIGRVGVWNRELSNSELIDIHRGGLHEPNYSNHANLVFYSQLDILNPLDEVNTNHGTSIHQDSSNIIQI